MTYRKKLIEVALPLEAINAEAAREKSIRHGHPSTLHLWWARRPLAACRAVLFGQLVDDPSSVPEEFPDEAAQDAERRRLFQIIEELVKWENSTNPRVLGAARREIARSVARWRRDRGEAEDIDAAMLDGEPRAKDVDAYLAEKAPPVYDPFCGGGSIPLEAQRLGLRAIASDLNPVAVLITKALIEIPPKFAGRPPVNPESRKNAELKTWKGAQGLAEDVRYYGKWMRDEAEKRIGHLYPKVTVTAEMAAGREDLKRYVGRELTVIAWLWARTVTCPNPACGATMPLVRSFWLSKKKRGRSWLNPVVIGRSVSFEVRSGIPTSAELDTIDAGTSQVGENGKKIQATFSCVSCKVGTARGAYIDAEADGNRLGFMPLAVACDGDRERLYLPTDRSKINGTVSMVDSLAADLSEYFPNEPARGTFASNAQGRVYGFKSFGDYFSRRQLVLLSTLSGLVTEVRPTVEADTLAARTATKGSAFGGNDSVGREYAKALAVYFSLAVSKLADYNSSLVVWSPTRDQAKTTFSRQALPMVWDFSEVNPFSGAAGDLATTVAGIGRALDQLCISTSRSEASQADATGMSTEGASSVFCTDPPYYDNISYADLSDYFYVWLRRSLRDVFPSLLTTVLTPKDPELVASKYRSRPDGKTPRVFFEEGLQTCFEASRVSQIEGFPLALFYAFKQAETDVVEGAASTGWDTMLSGLLKAGFSVVATWPMRTERSVRSIGIGTNALASSVMLTCRTRSSGAVVSTRTEFVSTLKRELPEALKRLQDASIAPVDLAQSAIGPGMAVFSRYAKVLEPDGTPMTVRTALGLINQVLDEVLAAEESEYDADTRWAITWFTQHGFDAAPYGEAETLSKARNTSVEGLVKAGILEARGGKVRLLRREELGDAWTPSGDARFTVWEACQHLIKALETGGEAAAADLLRRLGPSSSPARELAYRLYQHCERTQQAEEARSYNGLVVAWPRLAAMASERASAGEELKLDFGDGTQQ